MDIIIHIRMYACTYMYGYFVRDHSFLNYYIHAILQENHYLCLYKNYLLLMEKTNIVLSLCNYFNLINTVSARSYQS